MCMYVCACLGFVVGFLIVLQFSGVFPSLPSSAAPYLEHLDVSFNAVRTVHAATQRRVITHANAHCPMSAH